MAYEIAEYVITETIAPNIEIRAYSELVLATISANSGASRNNNFRALFDFISKGNAERQKIAMTTPVFERYGQERTMMSFVMPRALKKDDVPTPDNSDIIIESVRNVQFIVIKFSGRSNDANFDAHQQILEAKVAEHNIGADIARPIRAYYNSPFTPPLFRRNEILFRIN